MAKKGTTSQGTGETEEESPYDEPGKKIDTIRRIRADFLAMHHLEPKPAEIFEIFKKTRHSTGDREKDVNYISSSLSQIRKEDGGKPGRGRGRKTSASVPFAELSLSDLRKVHELAKANGGLGYLADTVSKVEELAKETGGLERLKKSLDALQEFTIK